MDGQSIGAVGCSTQFNSPHLYTGIINTQRGGMTRILKPSRSRTLFSSPQLSGCTCWVEYNVCLCWPAPWVAWHTFSGTCETTVLDLTCRRPITSAAWSTAPKTTGADRRKSRNNLVGHNILSLKCQALLIATCLTPVLLHVQLPQPGHESWNHERNGSKYAGRAAFLSRLIYVYYTVTACSSTKVNRQPLTAFQINASREFLRPSKVLTVVMTTDEWLSRSGPTCLLVSELVRLRNK